MKHYPAMLQQRPNAIAMLKGSPVQPKLHGIVRFYQTDEGVLVSTEVSGLPNASEICTAGVFGFHIHEGDACAGTPDDPFAKAGSHYNPANCCHPNHAGDLPPLFEANGMAFLAFLTNRFSIEEIIGKTVILHSQPDDLMTQPSGNSGTRIACGKVKRSFFLMKKNFM